MCVLLARISYTKIVFLDRPAFTVLVSLISICHHIYMSFSPIVWTKRALSLNIMIHSLPRMWSLVINHFEVSALMFEAGCFHKYLSWDSISLCFPTYCANHYAMSASLWSFDINLLFRSFTSSKHACHSLSPLENTTMLYEKLGWFSDILLLRLTLHWYGRSTYLEKDSGHSLRMIYNM